MSPRLQVADLTITPDNIFSLLAQKQMIMPLAKEIILEKAIADIECTPEEKSKAEQQFFLQAQLNPQQPEQLQQWLAKNYLTKEQLQEKILRAIKLERYKEQVWGDQLESYYLSKKDQLDKIIYSLIRTKSPGEAQELYFRISEGEAEFSQIAKEYSQGTEAQTGGLVGPVELSVPHPDIVNKLRYSQPGQLIPPVRIGEWIVILRLEKYLTSSLDINLRKRLLDELFNQWLNEQLQTQVKLDLDQDS
jgi:parvulin-like peptidyl-prolyl isomerase